MKRPVAVLVCCAAFLSLAACSEDDGGAVREEGAISGSGSGSGSGVASGSGSGSGISEEDLAGDTDNPLVTQAIEEYRTYVLEQVDATIAATTTMTDAIRAGDLEAAKAAYAPSRVGWESIEPIAGLVEEIDGKVDARVDDFAGEDDPEFTGWHRIEYLLWEQGDTAAAVPFADQLDADLQTLETEIEDIEIPPAAIAVGAAELVEEVSTGKITGEEDRYSHTDLWDFAANIAGAEKAIELLIPALEEADPDLLADIQAGFSEIDTQLAEYADGDGYKPFTEVSEEDIDAMKTTLAGLSENLSQVAGALGLEG